MWIVFTTCDGWIQWRRNFLTESEAGDFADYLDLAEQGNWSHFVVHFTA